MYDCIYRFTLEYIWYVHNSEYNQRVAVFLLFMLDFNIKLNQK